MLKFVREPHSQKWENNQDNFALTLMDMDLPLFPSFRQALLKKISLTNNFTYKYPSEQYYKSIMQWYRLRHIKDSKTQIQKDWIVQSPSVLNIIYLMIRNQTKQGDNILMLSPIFFKYKQIALHLKRKVIESRLYNEKNANISRYDINYSDLSQKAKKCKIMIFCNPHNPTGRIFNQQEVNKITQICQSNNILLISDQILSDLVPQHSIKTFYSLINLQYPRIVVANSISKTFNSSSIRGGYALIKDYTLRKKYLQTTDQLGLHLSQLAIYCVQIFYSADGLQWLKYIKNLIQQNYNYLLNKAKNTLLTISQLQAGYAIVIGFQGYMKFIERWYQNHPNKQGQSRNMVSFFLAQHKIKANIVPYLSQPIDILTDVRFTIAVQKQYFKKFADKLISILLQVHQKHQQIDSKL